MFQDKEMKFPIIFFEKNDSKMFSLDYKYFVGDIRFYNKESKEYSAFRNIEVIDSNGNLFYIKKMKKISGITLWDSIIKVGLMIKLAPILEKPTSTCTLKDLKTRVLSYIENHPKRYIAIDTNEGLKGMINEAKTFRELILIFK